MNGSINLFALFSPEAIFGVQCFAIGVLLVLLDWAILYVRNTTVLGISYASKNRGFVLLFWALGAGIFGLIGAFGDVVKLSLKSAVVVAIAWPLLLARLVEANTASPVQQPTEEVKA